MQNSLRMAVAGAGGIGHRHAQAITELNGAELAAICDIDAAKARELAELHGVRRHGTDLAALLADGGIDAVTICSDHGSHELLLDACAAAGVHCIVEKPLSIRLSGAIRMVETAKAAGIIFGAIFQRRFFPAAQRMKLTEAVTDLWTLTDAPDPREPWELTGESRPGFPMFHRMQLQDFDDAIRAGRDPAVTGAEALKALHMIKGIYLSQHRGMPVRLPLDADDIAELETFDTRA